MVKSVERVRLQSMESHIKVRWLMVNLSVNDLIFVVWCVYVWCMCVCGTGVEVRCVRSENEKNIQKLFNFFDIVLLKWSEW